MRPTLATLRLSALVIGACLWVFSVRVQACVCVIFNPSYTLSHSEYVFIGEITNWDEHDVRKTWWGDLSVDATPFTYRVVESFKGGPTTPQGLLALGRPSDCALHLVIGEHYLFTLNSDQTVVSQCTVTRLVTSQIEALRTVSSVQAAQSESRLPLSESQVLAIANALAKGQGFHMDEYSTPTIEHDKEGFWTVMFERKEAPQSGPRGFFWVTVIDADGYAELKRGPW